MFCGVCVCHQCTDGLLCVNLHARVRITCHCEYVCMLLVCFDIAGLVALEIYGYLDWCSGQAKVCYSAVCPKDRKKEKQNKRTYSTAGWPYAHNE